MCKCERVRYWQIKVKKGMMKLFYCSLSSLYLLASSAIREGTTALSLRSCCSLLNNEFVLDFRGIVLQIHTLNAFRRSLDLSPAINLEAKVLLDNVCVSVANADSGTLFDDIELLVEGHHLDTPVLISNDALGNAVKVSTVISSALADNPH